MMKRKLNCVLLIDDDNPTNFYNEMIIKEADYAEKIVVVPSGMEALNYLKSIDDAEHPRPDLIFLDLNMPGLNGWEFLEEYRKLDKIQQGRVVIVLLTTSMNTDDEEKAKTIPEINDFEHKPLTSEMLQEILERHFAE